MAAAIVAAAPQPVGCSDHTPLRAAATRSHHAPTPTGRVITDAMTLLHEDSLDLVAIAEAYTVDYWRLRREWTARCGRRRMLVRQAPKWILPIGPLMHRLPPATSIDQSRVDLAPGGLLALRTGLNRTAAYRLVACGWLTLDAADRAAAALDVHPLTIWGERWLAICALIAETETC